MIENYTRMVSDQCFDLVDYGLLAVWDEIENTPEDTSAERWKKKLEQIAENYAFSSRFALVRILCARALNESLDTDFSANGFTIETNTLTYHMDDVSSSHIALMTSSELDGLEQVLCSIADSRPGNNAVLYRPLIARALRDTEAAFEASVEILEQTERGNAAAIKKKTAALRRESKTLLTRQEAMQLGHILGLSLNEMSWFLLRVFDFEDGFFYHSSSDLIDAFGFLIDASLQDVEEIKARFSEIRPHEGGVANTDPVSNWTKATSTSFPYLVESWSANPQKRVDSFLGWLVHQSSYLDQPSRSAILIYRRLAEYASRLIDSGAPQSDRDRFCKTLQSLCAKEGTARGSHFTGSETFSEDTYRGIGADLLEKNKDLFTSAPDRAKAWRTVTVSEFGLPRLIMAGRPDAGRSRVQDLLSGTLQVEKGDLLHLLWFTFNLFWLDNPIYTPNDIFNALADFTEVAQSFLSAALLPPFYPPHIMEQSMMLSIVLCGEETGVPADVYAEICESLIMSRNRTKHVSE